MDHYVDIDIRPDPEFTAHQLMNALYTKLHRALVAQNNARIGVSFPGVELKAPHLGKRLRLHGAIDSLSVLAKSDWLAGMNDHVIVAQTTHIPESVLHCTVKRIQVKSNPERLRRRLMRRHDLDEQEAKRRIPDEVACTTNLPFVQLRSSSTGQSFRLFIEHGLPQVNAIHGEFNSYGLSQTATIPWF